MKSFALTGRSDLVRGLTAENFGPRLREWAVWYRENGRYLRFDERRGHLVVDEDAKRAGRERPLVIPPAEKPFPDWKGPVPTLQPRRAPKRPKRPPLQSRLTVPRRPHVGRSLRDRRRVSERLAYVCADS